MNRQKFTARVSHLIKKRYYVEQGLLYSSLELDSLCCHDSPLNIFGSDEYQENFEKKLFITYTKQLDELGIKPGQVLEFVAQPVQSEYRVFFKNPRQIKVVQV